MTKHLYLTAMLLTPHGKGPEKVNVTLYASFKLYRIPHLVGHLTLQSKLKGHLLCECQDNFMRTRHQATDGGSERKADCCM